MFPLDCGDKFAAKILKKAENRLSFGKNIPYNRRQSLSRKGKGRVVFSNLFFLYVFLPLNLILYYMSKRRGYRNAVLVVFSLIFYAWGEPVWVSLLVLSTLMNYLCGLGIDRCLSRRGARGMLVFGLLFNLGLLGFFKYSGFVVENLNAVTGLSLPVPAVVLPIGISFYTFQAISYIVDVYRGEVAPQRSYGRLLLYISLYPQLVAGPIVRYSDIDNEIAQRRTDMRDICGGVGRFIVGLGKKVLVANIAGQLVSQYATPAGPASVLSAWFAMLMFAIQIYFDFSGYSDMAIGLGRMFGFHYLENFNYPYIAKSITEFWRRWHISLGSFFRDYVYIPMGGNRRHQALNLLVVWFLTGLWHGASWNFVLWGLYFGVLLVLEKLFLGKLLGKLPGVFSHLYLLFAVAVSWTIFYFTDLGELWRQLKVMFGAGGVPLWDISCWMTVLNYIFWIAAAALLSTPILPRLSDYLTRTELREKPLTQGIIVVVNAGLLLLCTAMLVGQSYNPFLYYRF